MSELLLVGMLLLLFVGPENMPGIRRRIDGLARRRLLLPLGLLVGLLAAALGGLAACLPFAVVIGALWLISTVRPSIFHERPVAPPTGLDLVASASTVGIVILLPVLLALVLRR